MTNQDPQVGERSEHFANVALYLVFTILSCGLFNLYWNYRQMDACNELLGRDEFNFVLWLILSFITCGLYHLYYQYKMGSALNEIQRKYRMPISEGLPALSVLAAFFGFGVVADCIHQVEINKIVS